MCECVQCKDIGVGKSDGSVFVVLPAGDAVPDDDACSQPDETGRCSEDMVHIYKLAMLGQMTAGAIHDLNNLLMLVSGWADEVSRSIAGQGQDGNRIASTESFKSSIGALMAFASRIREFVHPGRQGQKTPVDVHDLVTDVITLTEPKWNASAARGSSGIRMVQNVGERISVVGDRPLLFAALTNLVFNAVDAMPAGGMLSIGAFRRADHVMIVVEDTGTGMQSSSGGTTDTSFLTTKPNGTGLGLTMVRWVLEKHGGHLLLSSQPGKGTRVTICLHG